MTITIHLPNIAPEGKKLVAGGLILCGIGIILIPFLGYDGFDVFLFGLLAGGFCWFFFRDPDRHVKFEKDEIACPADGTVMTIRSEDNPEITVVRIFLSIFNVHVQRAPVEGRVREIKYTKGTMVAAMKEAASKNERNRITLLTPEGRRVEIEQLTGSIARRIACWVRKEQEVKKAERVGMIYFGSQVAVYLPKEVRVMVKPGQVVQGGITVLALWPGKITDLNAKDAKEETERLGLTADNGKG